MLRPDAEHIFNLPDVLDPTQATALLETLKQHRGSAIVIDGRDVAQVSTVCMQVLLSAAKSWAKDGEAFAVTNPSDILCDALSMLGINADQLPIVSEAA